MVIEARPRPYLWWTDGLTVGFLAAKVIGRGVDTAICLGASIWGWLGLPVKERACDERSAVMRSASRSDDGASSVVLREAAVAWRCAADGWIDWPRGVEWAASRRPAKDSGHIATLVESLR